MLRVRCVGSYKLWITATPQSLIASADPCINHLAVCPRLLLAIVCFAFCTVFHSVLALVVYDAVGVL